MKLLTINTHSLVEENYTQKLRDFVNSVEKELPGIIAMQEVNQSVNAEQVSADRLSAYFPTDKTAVIRSDNHALNTAEMLKNKGVTYYWTWIPLKLGYGKYDEGMALMSRNPIAETSMPLVSETNDYNNWKTRKILGIRTAENPDEWFYSVHYGWWNDAEEPFQKQWQKTVSHVSNHKKVWLMGDFNSPAEVRNEGYDMVTASGFFDTYALAESKDNGLTVGQVIDGWRDKVCKGNGMRIDQIWCSEKTEIKNSRVIYNGGCYPVVSDHYGIIIEVTK